MGRRLLERGEGNIFFRSRRIYFDFKYFGVRVQISSGLADTPANRKKATEWLCAQRKNMDSGKFRFCAAFPSASAERKAFFSAKEGIPKAAKPEEVLFGNYVLEWYKLVFENEVSHSKKIDHKSAIKSWILPYFKDKTFYEINATQIGMFICSMKHKDGKNKDKQLSRKRIYNVLLPMRSIWSYACDKYRWALPDPFSKISKQLPRQAVKDEFLNDDGTVPREIFNSRDPLRFSEFEQYLSKIDPWYQPVAELWVLTGLIPSEMAGITRFHINDGYLYVRRSISRGEEKTEFKTRYRRRRIKITESIQRVLDIFLARCTTRSLRLITLKAGEPLTAIGFYHAWSKAETAGQLPHRVPYVLRHTFAAWSLTIGIDPNRLVALMGHKTKKMIYEVYGNYVEGLEQDREKIIGYYGRDYICL